MSYKHTELQQDLLGNLDTIRADQEEIQELLEPDNGKPFQVKNSAIIQSRLKIMKIALKMMQERLKE